MRRIRNSTMLVFVLVLSVCIMQCQLLLSSSVSTIEQECSADNADTYTTPENKKVNENVFDLFGNWIDGVTEEVVKTFMERNLFRDYLLNENVGVDDRDVSGDGESEDQKEVKSKDKDEEGISVVFNMIKDVMTGGNSDTSGKADATVHDILERARVFATAKQAKRNFMEIYDVFIGAIEKASASFDRHFGHIEWKSSLLISLWYWVEHEDQQKNPSWKRRQHRFHEDVDTQTVQDLHDNLFLSHLSYVDTVEEINEGLKEFADELELIYAQMESYPGEPAHFIALKKEPEQRRQLFWDRSNAIDVVLVVRGTKELGDVLSDVIMDATDYRGGKTHDGVASAGLYLAEKHMELMDHLLEASGRKKLRLTLTGHSLGAGAAAIAAIELNQHDNIEAKAVGFGCPALLTKDISETTEDYITTVIADSDVVPRLSGVTAANAILDMLSLDWTDRAVEDLRQFLEAVDATRFFGIRHTEIIGYMQKHLDKNERPFFDMVQKEREESVLIPPGKCIHIFRDGVGFSGKYTPCTFFNSIDVTRTMVRDHSTNTGYHRALLEFVRDRLDDLHFDFRHDLLAIAV